MHTENTDGALAVAQESLVLPASLLERRMVRFGRLVVFTGGVVPNSFFDAVGLVAGALRLPVWQFLIASFAGKGLRFWLLAVLGAAALPA